VITHARATDPLTSLFAAADVGDRRPALMDILLAAYADAGATGLTPEQAASDTDLLHTGYWKRVSDLKKLRLIIVTPFLRTNASGRQAQVYRITLEGRAWLKQAMRDLKAA